jgi:hypothetical protein
MRTNVLSKHIWLTLVAVSFSLLSSAQGVRLGIHEFGIGIGPLFFLGDVGGNYGRGTTFVKDVNMNTTKTAVGGYVMMYPTEWAGIRLAANYGKIEGYDHVINDKGGAERFRKDRNLQFRSMLAEVYVSAEFYPTVFLERKDGFAGKFRPYGVIGIGGFHFNPKGEYTAPDGSKKWVDLKPLRTEGQGMKEYLDRPEYALTQVEIPMGAGVKYWIKENFYMGMEVLHRKTFTDYIDDVSTTYIDNTLFANYMSAEKADMANQLYYRENQTGSGSVSRPALNEQRGNPKNNDAFFSTTLRLGWRIGAGNTSEGRAFRQVRCPSFF